MNFVRSNNVSLKYQRFATLGSKDIGIINSEFVAKTQFLFKYPDLKIKCDFPNWTSKDLILKNVLTPYSSI